MSAEIKRMKGFCGKQRDSERERVDCKGEE